MRKRKTGQCADCGADGPLAARGYCPRCYRVRRLAGEFGGSTCAAPDCTRIAIAKGLCEKHRNRQMRVGSTDLDNAPKVGDRASSWRGGRSITPAGYVAVTLPPDHPQHLWGRKPSATSGSHSRRILEHRLVMGLALGRRIRSDETVHHINGDRTDNRLENLQLRQGAHGPGVVLACLDCGSRHVEAKPL